MKEPHEMTQVEQIEKFANPKRVYVLEEIFDNGHKLNRDGTITLYHATTKEKAEAIKKQGYFKTADKAPDTYGVYFSTSPEVAQSYGDGTLIKVRVKVKDLKLDDAFPGTGRLDFQIHTIKGIYQPEEIIVDDEITEQPYLEKYRKLAKKYPARIDDHLERAKGEKASIVLGREFGEDFDSFLERRPDVKSRWNELTVAIKEMEQVRARITPSKGHLKA